MISPNIFFTYEQQHVDNIWRQYYTLYLPYIPILCAVLQGVSAAMTMTHQPTHVNSKPVVMLL